MLSQFAIISIQIESEFQLKWWNILFFCKYIFPIGLTIYRRSNGVDITLRRNYIKVSFAGVSAIVSGLRNPGGVWLKVFRHKDSKSECIGNDAIKHCNKWKHFYSPFQWFAQGLLKGCIY